MTLILWLSLLAIAAVLLAGRRRRRPRNSVRPFSPAGAVSHIGLRLVVIALLMVLGGLFGTIAPSLLEAVPALASACTAALALLLVWAAWPLLDLLDAWRRTRRPRREDTSAGALPGR